MLLWLFSVHPNALLTTFISQERVSFHVIGLKKTFKIEYLNLSLKFCHERAMVSDRTKAPNELMPWEGGVQTESLVICSRYWIFSYDLEEPWVKGLPTLTQLLKVTNDRKIFKKAIICLLPDVLGSIPAGMACHQKSFLIVLSHI